MEVLGPFLGDGFRHILDPDSGPIIQTHCRHRFPSLGSVDTAFMIFPIRFA